MVAIHYPLSDLLTDNPTSSRLWLAKFLAHVDWPSATDRTRRRCERDVWRPSRRQRNSPLLVGRYAGYIYDTDPGKSLVRSGYIQRPDTDLNNQHLSVNVNRNSVNAIMRLISVSISLLYIQSCKKVSKNSWFLYIHTDTLVLKQRLWLSEIRESLTKECPELIE